MKEITLGNSGKSAIIDDGDFDWLDKWKWRFDQNTGYAFRREYSYGKRLWISMHRVILSPAVGMMADHMNRDKLDNRRSNLRAVDSSGNNHNKGITTRNKSGIPGVCWREKTKRWRSSVGYQNRAVALGEFKNKDDAANAFIAAKLRISKGLAPTESLALDAAGRLGWTENADLRDGQKEGR